MEFPHRYAITYFGNKGGRCIKQIAVKSNRKLMDFAAHIRGLRQGGGQGSLPGIEDTHSGAILIREIHDIVLHYPDTCHIPMMYLIPAQPVAVAK